MPFRLYPVMDVEGGLAFTVIVDVEAREVWTLSVAGGDPVPLTTADREYISANGILEPSDLMGVAVRNMLVACGGALPFDDLSSALAEADRLLFEANEGREPRTDLPFDVVSAMVKLEVDGRILESQIAAAMSEFRLRLEEMRLLLTKPIVLPNRFAGPASGETLERAEADLLSRLDDIDESLMVNIESAVSGLPELLTLGTVGESESDAIVHVDPKAPLQTLGLSNRVLGLLNEAGIETVGQLLKKTQRSLNSIRGFGDSAREEVVATLSRLHLELSAPNRSKSPEKPKPRTSPAGPRIPEGFEGGHIKTFLPDRAYGFIVPTAGGSGLFFHSSAVFEMTVDSSLVGKAIIFARGADRRGRPCATEVREMPITD